MDQIEKKLEQAVITSKNNENKRKKVTPTIDLDGFISFNLGRVSETLLTLAVCVCDASLKRFCFLCFSCAVRM